MSGKSDVSKRALSSQASVTIASAIELHVLGGAICRRQAMELLDLKKTFSEDVIIGRAARRATYELEAAVHCAALTSIGCTLATLEAQGFEVRGLCEVRWEAEEREKKKDESPS